MGLSQDALGKRAGMTFQQIQKYERGTNSISARRLHDFAVILEISPMYFYEAYEQETPLIVQGELSAQAIHLVQDFSAIPSAKLRHTIAAFVREMAKEKRDGL